MVFFKLAFVLKCSVRCEMIWNYIEGEKIEKFWPETLIILKAKKTVKNLRNFEKKWAEGDWRAGEKRMHLIDAPHTMRDGLADLEMNRENHNEKIRRRSTKNHGDIFYDERGTRSTMAWILSTIKFLCL